MARFWLGFTLCVALGSSGCGKDGTTKQCEAAAEAYVSAADKRSQDSGKQLITAINLCSVACKGGSKDACVADDRVTVALCDLEGKQACDKMCVDDKNAAACEKAKTM